jgi:glycosyltransferase involved in cell wall biosynthesis
MFHSGFQILFELIKRSSWPNKKKNIGAGLEPKSTSIVVVNYNTLTDIVRLIFSAYRIMGLDYINAIVVVDNNSDDGSRKVLKYLDEHNLIHLISNDKQRYHGPGINQGINYLANLNSQGVIFTKYILILDSDVILLRKDLIPNAVEAIESSSAALAGEFDYHGEGVGLPHVSSILINPRYTWKWPVLPFIDHGTPSKFFYRSFRYKGLKMVDFKFNKENYLLHLGEGTLRAIYLQKKISNQYFNWSQNYHSHHFSCTNNGKAILSCTDEIMFEELGSLEPQNIASALLKDNNLYQQLSERLKITS